MVMSFLSQVCIQRVGYQSIGFEEELFELDRAESAVDPGDDEPINGVERGEQTVSAVAHEVVSAFLGHAGHYRKRGL